MVVKSYVCSCGYKEEIEKEMNDTAKPKCPICGSTMDRDYSVDVNVNRTVVGGYGYR